MGEDDRAGLSSRISVRMRTSRERSSDAHAPMRIVKFSNRLRRTPPVRIGMRPRKTFDNPLENAFSNAQVPSANG